MQLKEVGEFKLIDIISRQTARPHPSVVKAIGDDTAVVKTDSEHFMLVTTDILQEGIHFEKACTSPYLLGKKCLAVSLSDIAAMGGAPLYYLVSLSVPSSTSLEFIKRLYKGMDAMAKQFSTFLLGGDTVVSTDRISISVTAMGKAKKDYIAYRHGAKKGDFIYITGFLGDSALGLLMLKKNINLPGRKYFIKKHIEPTPRVEIGLKVSKIATSMIDISDGLTSDLGHILEQSSVGAVIRLDNLPLSRMYRRHCSALSGEFYLPALCGGEDYELLFTAHPQNKSRVEKIAQRMQIPITCIGEITQSHSELIILDSKGNDIELTKEGYRHF